MPLADVVAALSWKPAAIAGVGDRHGVPIEAGNAANLVVFDPDGALAGAPGGAGQPQPQHAVRRPWTCAGRVRHTVFRGAPVVVDGAATR